MIEANEMCLMMTLRVQQGQCASFIPTFFIFQRSTLRGELIKLMILLSEEWV